MAIPAGSRATLRDVVHQVVLAVIESLRAHESFWRNANAISELRSWGTDPGVIPDIGPWDYQALAEQARRDIVEITPLLEDVLDPGLFVRVMDNANGAGPRLDDELWVRTVYGFATAIQHGRAAIDHMADMFVPLYMWRAAAFMSDTAPDPPVAVQARLDALCDTFQRLKPTLVATWSNEV
jgi:glucosylglycerate synthase